jgi:Lrp/AsnC family transcriptional regulator
MAIIDLKDRRILAELDKDARQPYSRIAKKVGLSQQVVSYRVQRLRDNGVLTGLVTFINLERLGYRTFNICLEFKHMTTDHKNNLIEQVRKIPHVQWLASTIGAYNLVIGVNSADMLQFQHIFNTITKIFEHEIVNDGMFICLDAHQMPYPLLDRKREISEDGTKVGVGEVAKLQRLDYSILQELAQDCRVTNNELARKLKTDIRTVSLHVDNLHRDNIISAFKPLIDMTKLGYQWHLVLFKLKYVDPVTTRQFTSFLKSLPETFFVVNGVGNWNMQVEFYCKDDAEYGDVMTRIFPERFHGIIKSKHELRIMKEHKCNWYPAGKVEEPLQTSLDMWARKKIVLTRKLEG